MALRARGLAPPAAAEAVDLELREGEIVGVFGLVGAGRTRLARTLFGLEPATAGRARGARRASVASARPRSDRRRPRLRRRGPRGGAGAAHVRRLQHHAGLAGQGHAGRRRRLRRRARGGAPLRRRARDPRASIDATVETLSGGNQQKVVLARWSCSGARVLILDDPTRGIDVGAKEEVFRLVHQLAARGRGDALPDLGDPRGAVARAPACS